MHNTTYKLSEFVLKRFEENANNEGGLEILYNTKTNQYWFGNASSRYLVNLINGKNSLEDIFSELSQTVFKSYSIDEIRASFSTIINELETKELIEKV